MNTMNDMDDDTRREYNRYQLEVLQVEHEQDEQARRLKEWVGDSLQQALADYDLTLTDQAQVQHTVPEHTGANATVAANSTVTVNGHGVKQLGRLVWHGQDAYMLCYSCDAEAEYAGYCEAHYSQHVEEQSEDELQEWDEWLDDAYSAEELERAQQEQEEVRRDH